MDVGALTVIFGFAGNRGRATGPVQHHSDHGQLHVARSGNVTGGHAERVEVQRGPMDTRLSGRLRGKGGEVYERDQGRGDDHFGFVAEPVRRRRQRRVHDQERPVGAEYAADHGQIATDLPEDPVQRQRKGPER